VSAASSSLDAEARARLSHGASSDAIHAAVARALVEVGAPRGTLVDVGCGAGALARNLDGLWQRYVGCDIARYDGFPEREGTSFVRADLNQPPYPLDAASADVVAAVETIEHLENPRAFVRELVRIVRPGGWIVVTTPNQLSLLSKLTLVFKNQFNAFQARDYPAHVTALLEIDLLRIARECGLEDGAVRYTASGRIPGTGLKWPRPLGGRAFSDNLILRARRP
jgi:2-polyprenyl-3-methyl-5-hydroxy-6-metoxy-1,4-benzoquinol methylase